MDATASGRGTKYTIYKSLAHCGVDTQGETTTQTHLQAVSSHQLT